MPLSNVELCSLICHSPWLECKASLLQPMPNLQSVCTIRKQLEVTFLVYGALEELQCAGASHEGGGSSLKRPKFPHQRLPKESCEVIVDVESKGDVRIYRSFSLLACMPKPYEGDRGQRIAYELQYEIVC